MYAPASKNLGPVQHRLWEKLKQVRGLGLWPEGLRKFYRDHAGRVYDAESLHNLMAHWVRTLTDNEAETILRQLNES